MRYDSYDPDDELHADTGERRSGAGRTIAMLGAIALIATPALMSFARRWRSKRDARRNEARNEPAVDEALKETFPASDPPASRYFGIPENRL